MPDEDVKQLKRAAQKRGISMADLVRRLIGRALRKGEHERV